MDMARLRALILDYSDVLSWPRKAESVETMAHLAGVSIDVFRAA